MAKNTPRAKLQFLSPPAAGAEEVGVEVNLMAEVEVQADMYKIFNYQARYLQFM